MRFEKIDNMEDAPIQMVMHHLVHLSKSQAMYLLEQLGLKPSQAGIMFVLNCNGKLSQRELAEKIGVTPPSMTVALRKMEEMGYIAKEPDSNDQRISRIILTEKGEGCVEKAKAVLNRMEEIMFYEISPEEKMLLRRLLLQMRKNLINTKGYRSMDI